MTHLALRTGRRPIDGTPIIPGPWVGTLRPVPTPPEGTPTIGPFDWQTDADLAEDPLARSVTLQCSPIEASLLIEGCAAAYDRKPSRAWVDLADRVRDAHRARRRPTTVVDGDPTPAHGTPRPR